MGRKKTEEKSKISNEKLKKLRGAMDSLEKDFGTGTVMMLSEKPNINCEVVSTGSIGLDFSLGVLGIPKGRIIEIYGPESSGKTTLAMHIIANVQKQGGAAAIVDAEHAFDIVYAKALGINTEELLISQPDYGEQGLEVVDRLVSTGAIDVVVVDSVAALIPKNELEGEMGESKLGLHARLMSQALRKLTAKAAKSNTIIIFINQLRDKIGVMFGCLHADMPILFTDGRSIPIKKVVEEKIQGNVWCYNEDTKQIESKPIIDWHYNGNVKYNSDFIHIETESIDGKGRFGITVTPTHNILTSKGWIEARTICEGDKLLSKYESLMTGVDSENFIKGCLVGDSTISIRHKNTGSLKFQDSKNPEYVKWKIDLLSAVLKFKQNGKRWESEYTYEFAKLKKEIQNRNPLQVFKDGKISNLSLAIWIMDNGYYQHSHKRYHLSVKRFKNNPETLQKIGKLFDKENLEYNITKEGSFVFTVESSKQIAQKISTFIPPCMKYKLPILYIDFNCYVSPLIEKTIKTDYVTVLSKRYSSKRQLRQKGKYDISVEGNHNYLSGGYRNGIIVHNSSETTTGGNALKFYASVRLDVRRIAQIKDGDEVVANKVKVKIVKNKVAPPFKAAEFEIRFGQGIDTFSEILDASIGLGFVLKNGSWFSYNGDKLGQGREAVRQLFIDNNELFEEIKSSVLTELKARIENRN